MSMKKIVNIIIVFVLACNMFAMVSFAEIDFSGGLLDGKILIHSADGALVTQLTDNDYNTYFYIKNQASVYYVFDNPVNINSFRLMADTVLFILEFYDENNTKVYSYTDPPARGGLVELPETVVNVKKVVLYNKTMNSSIKTREFNVYGTTEEPGAPEPTVPTQVQNVHVVNITAVSALVSWEPNPGSENVIKYIIYVNGQKYGETTNTEYKIDNLQPNTSYNVTITAVNNYGEGSASEPYVFTTPELPPEPATQVKNVVIKNRTSTSATISWTPNPEAEKITKYIIYLNGEKYGETEDTEYVIEGLKEGEKYVVTVTAVNDLGEGPASEPITFTTSKIADISNTIKVQDILSSIAVLFTNLWPLLAFALALIAVVPITTVLKQTIRRRSDA